MTVLPDSAGREMFSDFLGLRFFASDYGVKSINQNLNFQYLSISNGYVMRHNLDAIGINNTPNIGTGLEENLGEHLLIHFVDVSVGYSKIMWNWNIGAGIGYFQALDKKKNLRLRASVDLFYEDISYTLGTYTDTTNLGFIVNGSNAGTYLKNIKYVNNSLCSSLGLGLMYRTPSWDFFANASWNYVLISSENVNFYTARVKIDQAIYYQSGAPVSGGILNIGAYTLQVGIIREFGL